MRVAVGVRVGVCDGAPGGVQQTYPTGSALQSATTSYLPSSKHVDPGIHWFGSSHTPGVGVRVGVFVGMAVTVGDGVMVTVAVTVGVTPGGIQHISPAVEHTSALSALPSSAHCCSGIHWFGVVHTEGVGETVGDGVTVTVGSMGVGDCDGVAVASGIHVFDASPTGPVPQAFEGTTVHVYVWFGSAAKGTSVSAVVWE